MIFYVLLTHGAKPTGKIARHPAARAQIANLRAYWKNEGLEGRSPRLVYDYQRKITGLSSLPNLSRELESVKAAGKGAIMMDNVARLFAVCEPKRREPLMNELLAHREHFGGLRQRGRLVILEDFDIMLLMKGLVGARFKLSGVRSGSQLSEEERQMQTADATVASRKARAQAADKKADELAALRKELTVDDKKPTLKMIAEEANTRGITTTRGGSWSSSTVGRMLKRLEETTQTESATHDQDQE